MRAGFSEFSYGYSLTDSVLSGLGGMVRSAPVFPSLISEGSAGGGYDVRIEKMGVPFFLQFKLSEYIGRSNGREWGAFSSPYYRFHLWSRRRSSQHEMLLDLERVSGLVYYVAPGFHLASDLNRCFVDKTLVQESIFVSPSAIGDIADNDEHTVAFLRTALDSAFLCSTPREIATLPGENFGHVLIDEARGRDYAHHRENEIAERLYGSMRQIITQYISGVDFPAGGPTLASVAYLSRTFFGAEMFVLPWNQLSPL